MQALAELEAVQRLMKRLHDQLTQVLLLPSIVPYPLDLDLADTQTDVLVDPA